MKEALTILSILFLGLSSTFAQETPTNPIDSPQKDTIPTNIDSLMKSLDAPIPDISNSAPITPNNNVQVKISTDSPDEAVNYDARDSMNYDIKNKIVYLYGEAVVTQNTLTLTAERITIDFGNNVVTAEGVTDSLRGRVGNPQFEDGEQNFTSKKMKYNIKTKKGIVYDAVTQEGDLYIHGSKSKFFQGVKSSEKDSVPDNIIYNRNAIFTTCNHPEPHFGIRCKKLKMIPDKVAVVGPSNIELGGVPTPLVLPFGFFPLKQGARTGLIFPRDYEYSQEWGFGLRNVGWYFPINDNWDTKVLTDIYFKGTWGITFDTRYKYRYKHSGGFNLAFSDRVREQSDASNLREKSLSLRWSHSQDRSAHPNRSFSASVNIQTNGFQSRNFNDANSVLTNSLSSNINYRQSFPGRPFNLTATMSHSQNTRSNKVTFNLPTVGLSMNRIYPFKKKDRVGKEKWYEKVSFKYDMDAQNRLETTDTTLFTKETLESAQYGMRHKMSSDMNFKIFKFINVSPNISYTDVWYGDEIERVFEEQIDTTQTILRNADGSILGVRIDTVSYGSVEENKKVGFTRYFQMNTGVNFNTTRYFTKLFKKGFIRGIRHVAKPRMGFSYTPDYTTPSLGYFKNIIEPVTPLNEIADTSQYSIFSNGVYGSPNQSGKQMSFTYGVRNNFEAKYWSKKDSTAKKIKLFDNIDVNGDYNFARDSLKWSDVRASGNTRFFNGLSNVTLTARWSPYALDNDRNVINEFAWNKNKKPLRFVNATMRTSTNFTIKQIRELITGKKGKKNSSSSPQNSGLRGNAPFDPENPIPENQQGGFGNNNNNANTSSGFLDLFETFRVSYNLNLTYEPSRFTGKDTLIIQNHNIETRGNFNLTENWRVTVGRIGYDFKNKKVTFPDFSFYRDLHCWEMGMSWQPERTVYSFFLRVKPSSLDFIELPYKKNNVDGRFGGF